MRQVGGPLWFAAIGAERDADMPGADVVIVGGGVMGSAAAYFLMASGFGGRVTVVERDPSYQTASTPRSAGGVRQQFSNPENVRIGLFGHHFVTHVGDYLAVDGAVPELAWREGGYLFLATDAGMGVLRENHVVQTAHGADVALLAPNEIRARFPWLRVDDLAGGTLGLSGEGWLDPNTLLQAFRRKARALGADYRTGEAVLERDGNRIAAARLADGTRIQGGVFVNAAGAQAGRLSASAGIALPVAPRKRIIYVVDCRERLDPPPPLTIDASGVFVRQEGTGYICGISPPEDQDPDAWDDLEIDWHWFEEFVWPALAHRIPAFEAIKATSAWAGWYDYNTLDQNGIVGFHPEVSNLLFANGFSGHGLQQSPAVGRAVMELVTAGRFQTIDLARFGYERIARGEKLLERNIV
jgi:FAD-dependent oxidoreductase domain-containing protein 1